MAIGQLKSSLSRDEWNDDGEGLDEEISPCGIGPVTGVGSWDVIRFGEDGRIELG